MAKNESLYDLLGVSQTASLAEIKKAYREQIRKYHPDNYAAERSKLQREGYTIALDALDREIQRAKHLAQKFNEAYSVLSDTSSRAAYDRDLSEERYEAIQRQMQRKRQQHPEYGRRAVKQRPHRRPDQPPTVTEQTIPWAILGVTMVILLFLFANLSDFLWQIDEQINTYSPKAPTAEGVISAADLQSTVTAGEATRIARAEAADLPPNTPLPLDDTVALGDMFLYEIKEYEYAVEQYSNAIMADADNAELYYKRGLAYAALYQQQFIESIAIDGIADFRHALRLNDWAEPYRERGLLHYTMWQQTGNLQSAEQALTDLQQYLAMSDETDSEIETAIADLEG